MKGEKQALLDIIALVDDAAERRRNQVNSLGRELATQQILADIKARAESALEIR